MGLAALFHMGLGAHMRSGVPCPTLNSIERRKILRILKGASSFLQVAPGLLRRGSERLFAGWRARLACGPAGGLPEDCRKTAGEDSLLVFGRRAQLVTQLRKTGKGLHRLLRQRGAARLCHGDLASLGPLGTRP